MAEDETLRHWAAAAAAGDRAAAQQLLASIQDGIYRLAVRMLGHPEDAEDATQEILVVILTQLGSFRGESALRTWAWRIAANHLLRARKGRRETVSFDTVKEFLDTGLGHDAAESPNLEDEVLAQEIRLRCTEAMMLSLDRESRLAYLLSDVFELSGEEAAAVLGIDHAVYRKRVSRARGRLLEFLRAQCGLFDPQNPCRCNKQVPAALARGLLKREELFFASRPVSAQRDLGKYAEAVEELVRAAEVVRHPDYAGPSTIIERMRELLDSGSVELLRN